MRRIFYGWWVTIGALVTFGIAVGIPYYNMPFFYDYYENAFGWPRHAITLGFPIAALLTLWVGPLLVPRFPPRNLILAGTGLTFLAFTGFSLMTGSLAVYYALWFVYTVGYILSGPIPHQIVIANWFRRRRGTAMGVAYVGVGLFGAAFSWAVKPLAENWGFTRALFVLGALMFLAWPIVILVLRNNPAEMGLSPDNDPAPLNGGEARAPWSFSRLLRSQAFWLLLIGSVCSIGAIGAVNQHMKLVFKDAGYQPQAVLNGAWRIASTSILIASIAGRLLIGSLADRFPIKAVMTVTYFVVAGTIPLLLHVRPPQSPAFFAVIFGFAMGADYMLIPLMAARQFGLTTLPRAMAILLPINTVGQTWVPEGVSILRERFGDYTVAMNVVLAIAAIGAIAVALMPRLNGAQPRSG